MIRQYLSNTNESVTIPILQNVLELNKAIILLLVGPCLVSKKFCKIFQIHHHIESLDVCMEY